MSSSTPSQDDWIRVTSRDGFSFIAKRSVVFRSGTLRNMLDERRTSTLLLISRVVHPDVTTPTRRQLRRGYTKSLSRRRKVPPSIPPSFRLRFSSPKCLSQGCRYGEIRRVPRLQDDLRECPIQRRNPRLLRAHRPRNRLGTVRV